MAERFLHVCRSDDVLRIAGLVVGAGLHVASSLVGYAHAQTLYAVGGFHLGDDFAKNSAQSDLSCDTSKLFQSMVWCTAVHQVSGADGTLSNIVAVLHDASGKILYAWQMVDPISLSATEVDNEISRLSSVYGPSPVVLRMTPKPGLPVAVIAYWGDVRLEPLTSTALQILAQGGAPHQGFMVDYLGDFHRSAREGVPVYRIAGGPGIIYAANYGESGRGNSRLAIADVSSLILTANRADAALDISPPIATSASPPSSAQAVAPTESRTEKALRLLALSLRCPSPAMKYDSNSTHYEYSSSGDSDILRITQLEDDFTIDHNQQQGIVGSEESFITVFMANMALLDGVTVSGRDLVISCVQGNNCLSAWKLVRGVADVSLDGHKIYGNIGIGPTRVGESYDTVRISNLCEDEIDSTALALRTLIGNMKPIPPNSYQVAGISSGDTVPIYELPSEGGQTIGQIPFRSGPLKLTKCHKVVDDNSSWCFVSWGGVKGWVPKSSFSKMSSWAK